LRLPIICDCRAGRHASRFPVEFLVAATIFSHILASVQSGALAVYCHVYTFELTPDFGGLLWR
jgi:hypothetical protein